MKRPPTSSEYLESLRDGREIWIYGDKVKDVTRHPAFRNAAVSISKLYDALHTEKLQQTLTIETDTGSGGYTQRFFRYARSREELVQQRDAIAAWARLTYGWIESRTIWRASPTRSGQTAGPLRKVRRQCATMVRESPRNPFRSSITR